MAARVGTAGRAGLATNAGTTVPCPAEFLRLGEFRRQPEVNLTRHLAVIQALLPLLRRGPGRIVDLSSVGGKVGSPMLAPYAAAKHAPGGTERRAAASPRPE